MGEIEETEEGEEIEEGEEVTEERGEKVGVEGGEPMCSWCVVEATHDSHGLECDLFNTGDTGMGDEREDDERDDEREDERGEDERVEDGEGSGRREAGVGVIKAAGEEEGREAG